VFVSFAAGIIHGHPTASVEKRRELLAELLAGSRVSLVFASWAVKASCQSGLVPPTGPVAPGIGSRSRTRAYRLQSVRPKRTGAANP
jgi:hypothetical protein